MIRIFLVGFHGARSKRSCHGVYASLVCGPVLLGQTGMGLGLESCTVPTQIRKRSLMGLLVPLYEKMADMINAYVKRCCQE